MYKYLFDNDSGFLQADHDFEAISDATDVVNSAWEVMFPALRLGLTIGYNARHRRISVLEVDTIAYDMFENRSPAANLAFQFGMTVGLTSLSEAVNMFVSEDERTHESFEDNLGHVLDKMVNAYDN